MDMNGSAGKTAHMQKVDGLVKLFKVSQVDFLTQLCTIVFFVQALLDG